ncbi:hypothetical protein PAPYR_12934 [Paratrimastix pyriformis]|uniref:Uncharacterized protein n=1 Tax=Paratrimastix pyriformis TaxID=342808 RepID=A0ABQ8U2N0_9EUKA|nr:hypothetical protein PAPYR_12934 [Paratrimastix pyriformis]
MFDRSIERSPYARNWAAHSFFPKPHDLSGGYLPGVTSDQKTGNGGSHRRNWNILTVDRAGHPDMLRHLHTANKTTRRSSDTALERMIELTRLAMYFRGVFPDPPVLASLSGGYWSALSPPCRPRATPVPPPCMALSPPCRPSAWPSLRTAAPVHGPLHGPLSALPPPCMALCMALSPPCRPSAWPSLRHAAPVHGPVSALPPACMALCALPPRCMALSAHCRPAAWPSLRTAAPVHGPLSAMPPPCRHPAWPSLRTAAPVPPPCRPPACHDRA